MKEYMYSYHYNRNRGHLSSLASAERLSDILVRSAVCGGIIYGALTITVILS